MVYMYIYAVFPCVFVSQRVSKPWTMYFYNYICVQFVFFHGLWLFPRNPITKPESLFSWHLKNTFLKVIRKTSQQKNHLKSSVIGFCRGCCCWLLVVGCCFPVTKIPVNDPHPIRPSRMWIVHLWLHLHDSRPLWVARWANDGEDELYISMYIYIYLYIYLETI